MKILIILALLAVAEVILLQVMVHKKWIQSQDEADSAPVPAARS